MFFLSFSLLRIKKNDGQAKIIAEKLSNVTLRWKVFTVGLKTTFDLLFKTENKQSLLVNRQHKIQKQEHLICLLLT